MIASGSIAAAPIAGSPGGAPPVVDTSVRVIATDIWRLTAAVTVRAVDRWRLLDVNPVTVRAVDRWRLRQDLPAPILHAEDYPAVLVRESDSRLFSAVSIEIKGDRDSWLWSLTAVLAGYAEWAELAVGDVVTVTLDGKTYRFRLDGHEQHQQFDSETFGIAGRTPTSGLDLPAAAPPVLAGATAKAVVQGLCAAAGIGLDWATVDWPLPIQALGAPESPIQAIQSIAQAVGASVRMSENGGTLRVSPRYPPSAAAALTLADDGVFTLADAHEQRQDHDAIDIIEAAAGNRTYQWETVADGAARIVSLTPNPWRAAILENSGAGHFGANYQGIVTESFTEEIEIIDGQGRIGKPCHGLVSVEWRYVGLGTLVVTEEGTVTTSVPGNSLAAITYLSRHHRWRCTANVPRVQVWIDQESGGLSPHRITVAQAPGTHPAPPLSDPLLSGVTAMVERGRNELADAASRRNVSLDLPLVDVPAVGDRIAMDATARESEWTGTAVSVDLRIAAGEMPRLTLGLERPA